MGTMVEFTAATTGDPGDYLIGERFAPGSAKPLRYMDQPSKDGASANCWSKSVGTLDVALLLGRRQPPLLPAVRGQRREDDQRRQLQQPDVQRRRGDRHRSRRGRGHLVPRPDDVLDLVDDVRQARAGMLSAATDLYGAGSAQSTATATAWSAVGVN